jgi:hypothetical protein
MMPRPAKAVDSALLSAALEGLELQKKRIDEQIKQVRAMLGRKRVMVGVDLASLDKPVKRRELSEAARKRIAAAQKKRWAEYRKKTVAAGE